MTTLFSSNRPPTGKCIALLPAILLIFIACVLISVSPSAAGEKTIVKIGLSRSPASLPVIHMMVAGSLEDVNIEPTIWTAPEQLVAMVQNGKTQMFSLPLTVALRLRARGMDIRLTNVNTWGGVRLITADPGIRGWSDLKGKKVFMPSRNSPPDILMRFFLDRAELDPDEDVQLVRSSVTEMAQLLRAGMIDTAVLTEPQATAALAGNPALRVAIDFEKEWRAVTGGGIPTLGFGAQGAFLEAMPELAERFEQAYRESLEWVLAHPVETGLLAEEHLGMKAETVERAIPNLGFNYRSASEARAEVEDFIRFLEKQSPGAIGDTIPDAAFYWR